MFVFVLIHFHREMLDMEPLLSEINQQIPQWSLYSVAAIVGSAFGASLNNFFYFIL
jgi:hypothetical protein